MKTVAVPCIPFEISTWFNKDLKLISTSYHLSLSFSYPLYSFYLG
jgi:hypothetical protein